VDDDEEWTILLDGGDGYDANKPTMAVEASNQQCG